jgi:hypothetical protein
LMHTCSSMNLNFSEENKEDTQIINQFRDFFEVEEEASIKE